MNLKASHKLMREILRAAKDGSPEEFDFGPLDTAEQIESAYEQLTEADAHWDYESDFRSGTVETGIQSEYSRHYESKSVATQTAEGEWIGWTYWFGGGKYGEPESVEWIENAYDLTCQEEEKLVVVRTFTKAESTP